MKAGPSIWLQVGQLHALAEQHVVAQADAGELQLDRAVERVEVGLPVLVEVADVLPVALGDVAVDRLAAVQQVGEELLGEVVRLPGGTARSTSGSST